jgi:hypothetical protein
MVTVLRGRKCNLHCKQLLMANKEDFNGYRTGANDATCVAGVERLRKNFLKALPESVRETPKT